MATLVHHNATLARTFFWSLLLALLAIALLG